jgi:hypothetical protein
MKNLIIKRVVKIDVWFTADEWQLYVVEFPVECRVVAQQLNQTLAQYVNRGEDRETVTRFVHSLMRGNSMYGAADSEPIAFLERALDEIFGEQE